MKVLPNVKPTPEQLKVINDHQPGVAVIRGAAGSGKTTTALLRFHFLVERWRGRRARLKQSAPVRALVLTFNRTLRGYIQQLASQTIKQGPDVQIEILTFGKWSQNRLNATNMVEDDDRAEKIATYGAALKLDHAFLCDEVDYVLGRYLPQNLNDYALAKREGRGSKPRVEQQIRRRIISEVIAPYAKWKAQRKLTDWNDLAVKLAASTTSPVYDVVVIDEAQDFSANQVRAVQNHLAADHSATYILDAAQRIYPRFFTWKEAGLAIPAGSYFRLNTNHRNTKQIATFATQLLVGLDLTDDGTIPDLKQCKDDGELPCVILGQFSAQMNWAIAQIKKLDLKNESVAFLHPKGGGWFRYHIQALKQFKLPYVHIAQKADWPQGSENIGLSTLHSAKGLEFDHVFILGLNAEVAPHGEDEETGFENLQRLLAMAVGRARKTVAMGFKANDAPPFMKLVKADTYKKVVL